MLLLARFKINGHSMEPQIKNRDQVLVSSIPYLFKSPQINDIVTFKDNSNKTLVKRIIRITDNGFIVQGDNKNDSLDSRKFGEVLLKQIMGKVISKL
jgi:nickel-type superoxide dismutase maturation protease